MARINIAHGAARPAGLGYNEPWLDDLTGIMYVGDRPVTGSNRNILVNGDFRVNQRGQSSYTGVGYTADMWKIGDANGTAQIVDGGISWTMPSLGMGAMYQLIEQYKGYAGKQVTASVECPVVANTSKWSLNIHDGITAVSKPITHAGITSTSLLVSENATRLAVYLLNDSGDSTPITTARAKLELGPISTLALDGPADYGAELARCQRYLRVYGGPPWAEVTYAWAESTTAVNGRFVASPPMRVRPSVSYSGNWILLNGPVSTALTVKSITIQVVTTGATDCASIGLTIAPESPATVGGIYSLISNDDPSARLILSAEL